MDGYTFGAPVEWSACLPQASSHGHDLLEQCLNAAGYHQSSIAPGLWKHDTRPFQFTLVVDNFGIKETCHNNANHLINTLKLYHDVLIDGTGKEYLKSNLDWDYDNGEVHLSISPFREKALKRFDNVTPSTQQEIPFHIHKCHQIMTLEYN